MGISVVGQRFVPTYSGSGPGTQLTTIIFVNTSASPAAAGVPTPSFGHPFRQGDVPAGHVVAFSVGGASQPFSVGMQSYWPDGSLKFAAFMLLPTFSIPGSGSQAVAISNVPGSWPAASNRTLAEVYDQGLVVNLPNYSSSYNGKSVNLSAWFNGDGNQGGTGVGGGSGYLLNPSVWLDGAAGKAWKIDVHPAQTEGGTADGTLAVRGYIVALNNASGGLGGYRWLGQVRQPWYNLGGTPTAGSFVFFTPPSTSSPSSGTNWSINPGGTGTTHMPLTWTGGNGDPLATQSFTFTNALGDGETCQTTETNNYFFGGNIDYQVLPVVLSGGSLPPTSSSPGDGSGAIANDGFAFLCTPTGSLFPDSQGTQFKLAWNGQGAAPYTYTFTGSGSGTVTPVPGLWPGTRINFATSAAKYNFFQGTGSIASETTLRLPQFNQSYWQSTKLFPPYNLSYQGASQGGMVPDTTFPFAWNPYSIGDILNAQPGVGDHSDIGILPNMAVVDFYNQSAASEQLIRTIGLCSGLQPSDFHDATTDTVVNLMGTTDYTGLPAASTSNAVDLAIGYTPSQPSGWGAIGTTTLSTEHEPNYEIWAYLRTGELQYFDMLADRAVATVLNVSGQSPSSRVPTTANAGIADSPGIYYCIVCGWDQAGGEYRSRAWANRNVQYAALLAPWNPTSPSTLDFDGTQRSLYLQNIADSNCNFIMDQFNTGTAYGSAASYVQTRGNWTPAYTNGSGGFEYGLNGPEWEFGDYASSMALGAVRGNTNAASFLDNIVSPRWNYIGTNYKSSSANGFWYLNDYSDYQANANPDNMYFGESMISADSQWSSRAQSFVTNAESANQIFIGFQQNAGGGGSGQGWTMVMGANAGNSQYVPNNGDALRADAAYGPPAATWADLASGSPNLYPTYWYDNDPNTEYYIVGLTLVSGPGTPGSNSIWTFDVSTTVGGSPIPIANTLSPAGSFIPLLLKSVAPPVLNEPSDFMLNIWQAACMVNGLGYGALGPSTTTNTLLWDILNRFTNGPGGPFQFYSEPESSNNFYENWDVRYLTQPEYAS